MSTLNQNLAARSFVPEFDRTLRTVIEFEGAFAKAFEPIQTYDGILENKKAFSVKTNNTPVVMTDYDTSVSIDDTRFGEATEIIYTNTDVNYTYLLKTNEAIDVATVNNDVEAAVADRMMLVGRKNIETINLRRGKFLSDSAGSTIALTGSLDNDKVLSTFNKLSKDFKQNGVLGSKTAYVTSDFYNAIVDHPLVSTGKNSTVNIDKNGIIEFKGFKIEEVKDAYFAAGDICYASADEVAIPFVGYVGSRIIQTTDFFGALLQSLGKGGNFVLDDNKKAIIKVTLA